jgi:phenylalanyl-tRNA synthetase beta chain
MKGDLEAILDLTGKLSEIEFRAEAIRRCIRARAQRFILEGERWFHWGCSS